MPNIGTTDKDVSSDIIYVLRKNFELANWKEISTMRLIPSLSLLSEPAGAYHCGDEGHIVSIRLVWA